jgi:nitronate monooxygenase
VRTALTELLGIEHPVVQSGMGWVSNATLTAATSKAGGFGILAAATLSPEALVAELAVEG